MDQRVKRPNRLVQSLLWALWIALITAQTALSFFLYDPAGIQALWWLAWRVWLATCVFAWLPVVILRRRGGVPRGRSFVHTTLLVDSGIHGVVRHPQYLSFILLSLFVILMAQHCLITVMGIAAAATVYAGIVPQEDLCNIEKFGDSYRRCMRRVPWLNALVLWDS